MDEDEMNTPTEVTDRLRSDGYDADLTVEEDGMVVGGGQRWAADDVAVDSVHRFEGQSNPDDESMVLAVTAPGGIKGVLTLPYGPDVSGPQADTIRKLGT